ncbi:GDP-mannose mannosyl hydrolase [Acinetobacter cumulans]|uniref:GDP-mannose mannosyl hydrolase n=1 Tax=Acinetobacter cumulans TaxID=2136182 RepID=UPI000D12F0B4|nr:GDP-mannose mannosyl hydrolase [Acinetobacter cumulans]QCO20702.1 GDP-mannose mannosyl hydrolase [Acinetobacter cumulans]
MWLPDETFKSVIQHTPLISIDLIVRNEQGEVLLGKRVNAPAKGYWFVPGGRVRKNETLDDAFVRLVREELGIESGLTRADAKFLGVFEHFYDDCVFGDDVSTHYVVLGYEIFFSRNSFEIQLNKQHSSYIWQSNNENINNNHSYSFAYLQFMKIVG